jgi:tight adherence protein B
MYIGIGILTFAACVFVIEMISYAYKLMGNPDRKKIKRRLKAFSAGKYGNEGSSVLRKEVLSRINFLNQILTSIPIARWMNRFLQQGNVPYTLDFFVMLIILLGSTGLFGGLMITRNPVLSIIIGICLALLPFFYIRSIKKRRMQKFERQLPDALELVARALKAGHAFSSGMQLAADEFEDPLGTEFQNTLDEINFGASVSDALKNLSIRVECPDLRYFIVSVIVQRETGGNLAEIIEKLAHLIRERFKLRGRVQVLAAEGKLSAMILVALPFLVVLALRFMNPTYITTLIEDPAGRAMAAMAVFLMVLGVLVMRKMIDIKI